MANYHSAYMMSIQSDIDLLIPSCVPSSNPDVVIRLFDNIQDASKNCSFDSVWYEFADEETLTLTFNAIGSYRIISGREVRITPHQSLNYENIRQPILGTILGLALQQRGYTVLHGSAVLCDESVSIFTGCKGQGKSTLAAWLNKEGFPLLSDDICATAFSENKGLYIIPSFPHIRLNPDVLLHLGNSPDEYPKVHSDIQKRTKNKHVEFCWSAKTVGAIYSLDTGPDLELRKLHGMAAVKEILSHMLINRFPENQPIEIQKSIFLQATSIANSIPVFRLTRPKDLTLLPETFKLLQENMHKGIINKFGYKKAIA